MPDFSYRVRDHQGGRRAGVIQASNRGAAVSQLRERGWIILGLDEQVAATSFWKLPIRWPVREIQMELALQQMAVTLRSGMTLAAAIELLKDQSEKQSIGKVWEAIQQRLQAGANLSQAMQTHRCFPEFIIQLVRVGEQTGNLAPVLERSVATMRERRIARQELVSAAIYPVLVLLLAAAATVYMVGYLIPRLEVYLVSLGRELPAMTKQLLATTHGLRQHFPIIVSAVTILAAIGVAAYAMPVSRCWIDRALLRLPLIGKLICLRESAAFSRIVSMLLASGITLAESLRSVPSLLNNRYLSEVVDEARERIMRGGQLADALDRPQAFSRILIRMVQVGEQTGDLTRVLNDAADYHESQFESLSRRIQALATPAITLLVGAAVGYVYVAFFVALFAGGAA